MHSLLHRLACLLALLPAMVQAQSYPAKPIRIIVPFSAGGPTDTHSRWAGQQITAALGQQVIVENRGGSGGTIGTELAAKAAPDGYTLLGGNPGPLTIAPSARRKLGYDPLRDFAPITLIARSASCMCVHPSVPARNLQDFIALVKRRPGKINYATPGAGTVGHFAIESFAARAGIKMTMVPYKGAAAYLVDLMAGNIDFAQVQIFQAMPLVTQGKLRALGVTAAVRSPLMPTVPTASEQGLTGWSSYNWNGILAPAGTPKAIIDRLHEAIGKPLRDAATRRQLQNIGYEVSGDGPAAYAVFIRAETEYWAKVGQAAGIAKQ